MNIDESVKNRLVAELRLFRAFTYMRLTTWFGDVPFLTSNPTLPESKNISRTSADEIKAFIHSELEAVSHILPKNTEIPTDENGRVTCGTAVALNARAYLLDNDFENCARECEKLINSSEYGTYALASSYADLFVNGHYGSESILTLEYAYEGGVENIKRSWDTGSRIPQSIGSGAIVAFSPTQELVNCYRKTDGSVADDTDYENRDLRFYATIAYNGCTIEIPEAKACKIIGSEGVGKGTYTCWTNPDDAAEAQKTDPALVDAYNGTQDRTLTGYYNIKNYVANTVGAGGGSYKPLMEMRYADVLLMYAESMYETGQLTSEIWDMTIRPLRERSGVSGAMPATADPYLASYYDGVTDKWILECRRERSIELYMENTRRDDLMRWRMGHKLTVEFAGIHIPELGKPFDMNGDGKNDLCFYSKSHPKSGSNQTGVSYVEVTAEEGDNVTTYSVNKDNCLVYILDREWADYKYLYPVPKNALDINPNLRPQNPGWDD